jgi:hypothetical protein
MGLSRSVSEADDMQNERPDVDVIVTRAFIEKGNLFIKEK